MAMHGQQCTIYFEMEFLKLLPSANMAGFSVSSARSHFIKLLSRVTAQPVLQFCQQIYKDRSHRMTERI